MGACFSVCVTIIGFCPCAAKNIACRIRYDAVKVLVHDMDRAFPDHIGILAGAAVEVVHAASAGHGVRAPFSVYVVVAGTAGDDVCLLSAPDLLDAVNGGAGQINGVGHVRACDDVFSAVAVNDFHGVFPGKLVDPDGVVSDAAQNDILAAPTCEKIKLRIRTLNIKGIITGTTVHNVPTRATFYVIISSISQQDITASVSVY